MFTSQKIIHLRDTDATGVLYFAQQLRLALEAFEEFIAAEGLSLGELIGNRDFLIPIVHCEADYFAPLLVGDKIEISISLKKLGTSSFTLNYGYYDITKEKEVGAASIVHVATSNITKQSIPIPSEMREILEKLATQQVCKPLS